MKTSDEIIELLKKHMSLFNNMFSEVVLRLDFDTKIQVRNTDSLLEKMHELSLSYVVVDMMSYSPFDQPPIVEILIQPSIDGQTNIDADFMEELAKLNILQGGWSNDYRRN